MCPRGGGAACTLPPPGGSAPSDFDFGWDKIELATSPDVMVLIGVVLWLVGKLRGWCSVRHAMAKMSVRYFHELDLGHPPYANAPLFAWGGEGDEKSAR